MMRLLYYSYLLICYFTQPFRWLMVWWPNANVSFGVKLLFWNNAKYNLVMAQIRAETGFTSHYYLDGNNCFNMGSIKDSSYQSGSTSSGGRVGEPGYFATYSTVYSSIFDFYDYTKNRFPSVGSTLEQLASRQVREDAPMDSYAANTYAQALKKVGFYTASASAYGLLLFNCMAYYKSVTANTVFCLAAGLASSGVALRSVYNLVVHKKKVQIKMPRLMRLLGK